MSDFFSISKWLAERGDANTWTDTDLDRRVRCLILWTKDSPPVPLDRYERTIERVRESAALVRTVEAELAAVIKKCEGILAGREFGRNFWQRWEPQLAALEKVLARERFYEARLEEAKAGQRELRAGRDPGPPR